MSISNYTKTLRPCEWCEEPFVPKTGRSKFCDLTHITQCKGCNQVIEIKLMKRIPTYCSGSCSSKGRTYKLICEICNDEFISGKSNGRFCSKKHYKACVACKKDFLFNPRSQARACSKECAASLIDYNARNAKTVATLFEKYGENVTNASQLSIVKAKKIETSLANYGVENPSNSPEIREKRKKTNIERYGVENGGGAPEVQAKIRKTNLERYGVENVFQVPEVKNKIKATLQERYGEGVINPLQVDSIKAKARASTFERFGVESILSLPEIQLLSSSTQRNRISNLNRNWKKELDERLEVNFKLESLMVNNFYADLALDNIYIDINPSFTHNSSYSFSHLIKSCKDIVCTKAKHKPKAANSHQERFLAAEAEGKTFLQYFDWYDKEIFQSVIQSKFKKDKFRAYARKCELKEISQTEANKFFKVNHLLGATKMQSFCIGLYYNDELVHVNTYGKARFNKTYEWEAIRSASKMNWQVQGGFSKCDAYFFKTVQPKSVVSYVDLNISTGATELMFPGWSLLSTNAPQATWVNLNHSKNKDKPRFVKASAARRLSADRLLGMSIGEKYPSHHSDGSVFTNDEVLLAEGYVEVFDAGTRTFVWIEE